jgi:hypothetical protein
MPGVLQGNFTTIKMILVGSGPTTLRALRFWRMP